MIKLLHLTAKWEKKNHDNLACVNPLVPGNYCLVNIKLKADVYIHLWLKTFVLNILQIHTFHVAIHFLFKSIRRATLFLWGHFKIIVKSQIYFSFYLIYQIFSGLKVYIHFVRIWWHYLLNAWNSWGGLCWNFCPWQNWSEVSFVGLLAQTHFSVLFINSG